MHSSTLTTSRLRLQPLAAHHNNFIFKLVNSTGWLQFIGDRNVRSAADALQYIHRIMRNADIQYWVVDCIDEGTPIGIITLIKREYLAHHDIGFAFLPAFANKGYAYEAALAVLNEAVQSNSHTHIHATTIPTNSNSIKLLEKLGLTFEKEITIKEERLMLYGVPVDQLKKAMINNLSN